MDIESYCEKLEEWSEMSVNKYECEALFPGRDNDTQIQSRE